jgi:hypothetical protein
MGVSVLLSITQYTIRDVLVHCTVYVWRGGAMFGGGTNIYCSTTTSGRILFWMPNKVKETLSYLLATVVLNDLFLLEQDDGRTLANFSLLYV